ncbi:MAG: hypothetical protein Q7P63_02860 [Verrucomicrobiota bacterium JB022]|nr:hypothetical protein [Verrucomicrobiota bacterium JB022]
MSVPPATELTADAKHWRSLVATTRRSIHLARLGEQLARWGLWLAFAAIPAALLLQELWPQSPGWWCAAVLGGSALAIAVLKTWRRRTRTEAVVMDVDLWLGLHHRLVLAWQGILPWPSPQPRRPLFRWHWQRPALQALGAVVLLAIATLLSSSPEPKAEDPFAFNPPEDWSRIEAMLDQMEDLDVVEPAALEQWRERLEDLTQQDEQRWFDGASLEATQKLRNDLQREFEDMASQMAAASHEAGDGQPWESGGTGQQGWEKLVDDLAMGDLPLQRELVDKLSQMNQNNPPGLDQKTADQLRQRMRDASNQVAQSLGLSPDDLEPYFGPMPQPGEPGENGEGQGGEGGPDEGGGTAPMILQPFADLPTPGLEEQLAAELDPNRALPGDTLGVSTAGAPEEAADFNGSAQSRATLETGARSDARLSTRFRPREAEVIERYFQDE